MRALYFLNDVGERMLERIGLTIAAFAFYLAVAWGMYAWGGPHPAYTLPVMVGGHVLGVAIRMLMERRP